MTKFECTFCDEIFEKEIREFTQEKPQCPSCENTDDVIESEEDEWSVSSVKSTRIEDVSSVDK